MYKTQRNYENVQRALFNGVGCYEIPMIEPTQFDNAEFIGFNMQRMQKMHMARQYISFWMIINLIEYGQIRIGTFLCYKNSSMY